MVRDDEPNPESGTTIPFAFLLCPNIYRDYEGQVGEKAATHRSEVFSGAEYFVGEIVAEVLGVVFFDEILAFALQVSH